MKTYIQRIDVKTPGPRYDVTPLFADHEAFHALVEDLIAPFLAAEIDYVAGIDALGFILGAAMAFRMQKGFLPIRKGGKLPVKTHSVEFVDYSGQQKSLEIRTDAIRPGARILLVDEWVETGAQVSAAIELIEGQKGVMAGIATICMDVNSQTSRLQQQYNCHTVWAETG